MSRDNCVTRVLRVFVRSAVYVKLLIPRHITTKDNVKRALNDDVS